MQHQHGACTYIRTFMCERTFWLAYLGRLGEFPLYRRLNATTRGRRGNRTGKCESWQVPWWSGTWTGSRHKGTHKYNTEETVVQPKSGGKHRDTQLEPDQCLDNPDTSQTQRLAGALQRVSRMALQQHVVVMLCNGSLDLASKGVFQGDLSGWSSCSAWDKCM